MIDCGEGAQVQLVRFGFNLSRIHQIFISHLHGDHVFGLFGLLSSMGMTGRKKPLQLIGPAKLEELMRQHLAFFGPLPFELEFIVPGSEPGGLCFEDDKLKVSSIPLRHRTTTFGYLFREKERLLNIRKELIGTYRLGIEDIARIKEGNDHVTPEGEVIPNDLLTLPPYHPRSYAYLSDTLYDPGIAPYLKEVDLLFHEATFAGKDEALARETFHSTAVQAAMMAEESEAGRLLIGHFSTRYRDPSMLVTEARELFSRTEGVEDGATYSVPLTRVSRE